MSEAAQDVQAPPAPEEMARANAYAMAARLFYAGPDQQLLGELAHAPQGEDDAKTTLGKAYVTAWRALVEACRSAFPVRLDNEHTELFASPGKAQVTPYLMHYVIRYESESPLVALREHLASWGLARRAGTPEPEDHVASMCEVMRIAIAVQQRPLEEQKAFFERWLYPGASAFCNAVSASPSANFYRIVADYLQSFLAIEREAFSNL